MRQPDDDEVTRMRKNAAPHAAESLAISPSPPLVPQVAKILIVDDDPVVRSLMQDALEDDGFAVIEAADGLEACRCCEEEVPLLVVVDAVMPNMDGFEFCQALRRRRSTNHLPILMATGLEDDASIVRAYEAGATDFISKPLNWLVLRHRVRYMLRGARVLDDLRENQTILKAAQEQERRQRERFQAALGNMSQGLCMFGADERLIVSNRRFEEIYHLPAGSTAPGLSMIEVLRTSPSFPSEHNGSMNAALTEYLGLCSQRASALLMQELADGRTITVTHEPMSGGGFVDTFTDITGQRRAEAQIAHMALHDPLTDLPNRVLSLC